MIETLTDANRFYLKYKGVPSVLDRTGQRLKYQDMPSYHKALHRYAKKHSLDYLTLLLDYEAHNKRLLKTFYGGYGGIRKKIEAENDYCLA